MEKPILSVIIPTYKRAGILKQCLEHLEKQTIRDQLEIIVVSDGPDSDAAAACSSLLVPRCSFFEVPKSQQGIARNKGVKEASGQYVIFIGDDIFLAPDACEIHLRTNQEPVTSNQQHAVLGFTTWDPSVGITPVMRWLEKTGWQFGYGFLKSYHHQTIGPSVQHRFTYTSHISLPREVALKFPFREDVTLYGWEDIEWGARLRDAGIRLFYEPDAKALHHHHLTLEDSLTRMETLGESAVLMEKIAPELNLIPRGFKKFKYQIASLFPTIRGLHAKAFLSGVRRSTS